MERGKLTVQQFSERFKFSLIHKTNLFNLTDLRSKAPARAISLLLFLTVFVGEKPAHAVDFQTSRILALGTTGRGGALLNDTILLNPSLLGFQPVQSISGTYKWVEDKAFNVSVIDGKNKYFQAGIGYTRMPDLDFIHLALAKRATNWLSFGTTAKRYSTRANNLAANGQEVSGFDGGPSVSVAFPKEVTGVALQLGLTGDNLTHKAADEKYLGPKQAGAGIKVNLRDILLLYGDYVQFFPSSSGSYNSYAGAAELSLGADLYARAGLFGFREKGWSLGAGWLGPKIGINYGYQNKRVAAERSFEHAVTMDLYM